MGIIFWEKGGGNTFFLTPCWVGGALWMWVLHQEFRNPIRLIAKQKFDVKKISR